jgi:predicted dehydrogenase
LQIGVGQVRRYAGPTASARSLVERGILGPIVRVMAADGVRMRGTGRGGGWHLADRASGGGVLAETGSHLIDQLIHVVGGVGASLRECSQQVHLGLELASSLVADVTTGTGRTVECRIEVSLLEDLCNGVFVEYPTCMLRVGLAFDDTLTLVSKRNQTVAELVVRGGATSAVQAFYLEWMDFLSQCRTGIPSTVDAATVRTTTALIEDAIRAGSREPAEELSLVARAR